MYEIEGKVKKLFDKQEFNKGFVKREFVITTREQYPQDVKLECTMDRVDLLDKISEGDDVVAKFNIRGNEYQGRYFVNLQAWSVTNNTVSAPSGGSPSPSQPANSSKPPLSNDYPDDDDTDDLPF
jgi:hypothetical protein